MTGTTEIALLTAGIGILGSAVAAPFVTAALNRRNSRRAAHEPAVGAARLIQREMENGQVTAQDAAAQGLDRAPLPAKEWEQHKAAVANRLSREELLVLDRYYAAVTAGAVPAVLALHTLAAQAINWLAAGDVNVTKPRKTETSLAPLDMNAPCRCGHPFSSHHWRARRRRTRITRRQARFKDIGLECRRCSCTKFRGRRPLTYI